MRLAVLSTAVVLLVACAGEQGETVVVAGQESGRTVDVAVGDKVALELASNPTTGLSWNPLDDPDTDVVSLVGREYEPSSDEVGVGGTEMLVYEAVGEGTATIELGYFQPWEPAEVYVAFTITVTVSE